MNNTHLCFLCRYNTHRDSVDMHQFIQENVGTMHLDALSREVHLELTNRREPMDDVDVGICLNIVREHIASHTLNPVIRVGMMLRELLDLKDRVRGDLHKTDANGQQMGLDPKMIDVYLRLQGQIVSVFKSEPAKMQFIQPASGRDVV